MVLFFPRMVPGRRQHPKHRKHVAGKRKRLGRNPNLGLKRLSSRWCVKERLGNGRIFYEMIEMGSQWSSMTFLFACQQVCSFYIGSWSTAKNFTLGSPFKVDVLIFDQHFFWIYTIDLFQIHSAYQLMGWLLGLVHSHGLPAWEPCRKVLYQSIWFRPSFFWAKHTLPTTCHDHNHWGGEKFIHASFNMVQHASTWFSNLFYILSLSEHLGCPQSFFKSWCLIMVVFPYLGHVFVGRSTSSDRPNLFARILSVACLDQLGPGALFGWSLWKNLVLTLW